MWLAIDKMEQSVHHTDGLKNPQKAGNDMVLGIYRNHVRTVIYKAYTKKTFGEYWDIAENKKIPKRAWTQEMRMFYADRAKEVPKPPYLIKVTIFGWIFLTLCIGILASLVYDSFKPPLPKSAQVSAMEAPLVPGDVFFGHFEAYKKKGDRIASGIGFGWFKIVSVKQDTFYVAKSTVMSKNHQSSEKLNSTDFEMETIPATITEKSGYTIRLMATDGKTEYYLDEKKP